MKQVTAECQITIKVTFKILLNSQSNPQTLEEQFKKLNIEVLLGRLPWS